MRTLVAAAGLLALSLLAPPATAHHSILGQFDVSKTMTLRGTIARVDWINPHPYIHLDTRAANGTVTTWRLSSAPIAMLRKAGLTKERIAGTPGEMVTITANPALNGQPMGWVTRITYADGHFFLFSE
jgi:hypothetical protein